MSYLFLRNYLIKLINGWSSAGYEWRNHMLNFLLFHLKCYDFQQNSKPIQVDKHCYNFLKLCESLGVHENKFPPDVSKGV